MRLKRKISLLLALHLSFGLAVAEEPKPHYAAYTSKRNLFSCELPAGWGASEEESPTGAAAHFLGPVEADGTYRAAVHIRYFDKGKPGFVPPETALKREHTSDKLTGRTVTPMSRWRIAKIPARRFEIVEQRQLPLELLPSRSVVLHHFFALVPFGDSYFTIRLSSSRETYLEYKADFDHLLTTFQITGAP